MASILDITELIVNYRTTLITVSSLILYSMPSFLIFVIPISVTMSVLLNFLKMSSENEITALKASGVDIYNFLIPVFIFCSIGVLVTFITITYLQPSGRMAFVKTASSLIAKNMELGIKERCFNDNFDGIVVYASRVDIKNKSIKDIFIEDKRTDGGVNTVLAPKGKILPASEKNVFYLRLFNGVINQTNIKSRTAHSIYFDKYDIKLDIKKKSDESLNRRKNERDMKLKELVDFIKAHKKKGERYFLASIELNKKFSIPFACLVLGMVAMPLGIKSKFSKRSFGTVAGLFLFLFYYLILSAGVISAETGRIPAAAGVWFPNILMLIIGFYLLKNVEKR